MSEWQPIETAPQDGTDFLACVRVRHVSGRQWTEMHVIYCDEDTGDVHSDCDQGWSLSDYEHWMPLPEAPK